MMEKGTLINLFWQSLLMLPSHLLRINTKCLNIFIVNY